MTPLRRQMLLLAFVEGLSHDEIAFTLGLPLGTVKSHLRRALRAMHIELTGTARGGRPNPKRAGGFIGISYGDNPVEPGRPLGPLGDPGIGVFR